MDPLIVDTDNGYRVVFEGHGKAPLMRMTVTRNEEVRNGRRRVEPVVDEDEAKNITNWIADWIEGLT